MKKRSAPRTASALAEDDSNTVLQTAWVEDAMTWSYLSLAARS